MQSKVEVRCGVDRQPKAPAKSCALGGPAANTPPLAVLARGCLNWVRGQVSSPSWQTTHSLLFLTEVVFAGMEVLSNPALQHIPPLVFAAIRLAIALPFLCLTSKQEGNVDLSWWDYFELLVLGLTGVGIPQSVMFVANEMVGAGLVGILVPLITAFTALIAGLLGLERVGPLKGAGVTMAFGGAMLIAVLDGLDFSQRNPWGTVALLAATFSYALYMNLMYLFLRRKPYPFTAYFMAVLFGQLYVVPAACIQAYIRPVDWAHVPLWVWLVEIYNGVLVTAGAHVVLAWAVHHVAPVLTGVYGALAPPLTVTMASVFLGERFHVADIGCMALILSGICIVVCVRSKEPKENLEERELEVKKEPIHKEGHQEVEMLLSGIEVSTVNSDDLDLVVTVKIHEDS